MLFGSGSGALPKGIKAAAWVYQLPQTNLDAESTVEVTAGISEDPYIMELEKDTHFTVDYEAGTVNFGARNTAVWSPDVRHQQRMDHGAQDGAGCEG